MRIEIVVDGLEPLSGRVSVEGAAPVAFSGWLGLLRILEQVTASGQIPAQRLGDQFNA